MTREPIVIHPVRSFPVQNTELTLLGGADLRHAGPGDRGAGYLRQLQRAQTHTLAVVDIAAQNIENRALLPILQAVSRAALPSLRRNFVSTPVKGCWRSMKGAPSSAQTRHPWKRSATAITSRLAAAHRHDPGCAAGDAVAHGHASRLPSGAPVDGFRAPKLFAVVQPPPTNSVGHRNRGGWRQGFPIAGRDAADHPVDDANVQILRRVLNRDISVLCWAKPHRQGYFARPSIAPAAARQAFVSVNCAADSGVADRKRVVRLQAGRFTGATREGKSGGCFRPKADAVPGRDRDMPLPRRHGC